MKTLILLAFMLIVNVFASLQETFCGDKSLSYCINHLDRQCKAKNYFACQIVGGLHTEQEQYSKAKKYYEMVCDKANSKDSYQIELINGRMGQKAPAILGMQVSCNELGKFYYNGWGVRQSYEKALQYWKKLVIWETALGVLVLGLYILKAKSLGKAMKKHFNMAKRLVS